MCSDSKWARESGENVTDFSHAFWRDNDNGMESRNPTPSRKLKELLLRINNVGHSALTLLFIFE